MFDKYIAVSLRRCFTTSSIVLYKDTGEKLRARFMNKLMTKGIPKKKTWYKQANLPPLPTGLSTVKFGKNKSVPVEHNTRRRAVLDKLFTRHITDILATEELGKDVYGYGIELTKVQVHPDFRGINVFWLSSDASRFEEAESALNNIGRKLQHELTRLQLMGNVPRVTFVKDKTNGNITEVEHLLSIADFGEDFVPTNLTRTNMAKQAILNNKQTVLPLTDDIVLKTNLLKVNRGRIMEQIQQSMKRARGAQRNTETTQNLSSEHPSPLQPQNTLPTMPSRNKDFSKFIKARQLMQAKILKETSSINVAAEFDYNEYEFEQRRVRAAEDFEKRLKLIDFSDENNDFVEEEEKWESEFERK